MPNRTGRRRTPARAARVASLLAWTLLAPEVAAGQGDAASPVPAQGAVVREIGGVRIDGGTFWYDCAPPAACAERIAAALEWVLREYPERFPRPLPVVAVIRAVPRERAESSALWSTPLGAYGCATLERGIVVIEVGPRTFVGRDALNDAELRSMLAHELLHAQQYTRGEHAGSAREIARRELEALDWEIAHLEAGVRPAYHEDLEFNRRMFAAMLEP